LQSINETGSIAAAGRRMGIKRAWYLIDTLNAYFKEPVVVSIKGGVKGGGASLTETGKAVLAHYQSMQRKAEVAADGDLKKLAALASRLGSVRKNAVAANQGDACSQDHHSHAFACFLVVPPDLSEPPIWARRPKINDRA
jgi:molybdate transport system regulatory protein